MSSSFFTSPTAQQAEAMLDTETITITRLTWNSDRATGQTKTTIYSGAADFQVGVGSTFVNPQGVVDTADAMAIIDADTAADLPGVDVGDTLTVSGTDYTVVVVGLWQMAPVHLELQLKRGPLVYKQK